MTKDRARKAAIRKRMAHTGEKYTEAQRALGAEPTRPRASAILGKAAQPGTVTAVVNGGGMTNLGFALPTLIALQQEGHSTSIMPLGPLPHLWDLLTASGTVAPCELAGLLQRDERDRIRSLLKASPISFRLIREPISLERWRTALSSKTAEGSILFVQDVQASSPIRDWSPAQLGSSNVSGSDVLSVQLGALRTLARDTGAIIIVGHCAPRAYEPGWRIVASVADTTLVLDDTPGPRDKTGAGDVFAARRAQVHSYDHGTPRRREATTIDLGFARWRSGA